MAEFVLVQEWEGTFFDVIRIGAFVWTIEKAIGFTLFVLLMFHSKIKALRL